MNAPIIPFKSDDNRHYRIAVPPSGSVTFTIPAKYGSEWAFFASAEIWATANVQLTYVKGYVSGSRSNIYDLVASATKPFSITGSANDKSYTFSNNMNTAYTVDISFI